ncbi:MAG: superinfection immunity protein [Endomicrobia bacterium]|nr:superinfection immunity protein [Endomicrobiia bacterium]MCL2506680.1 superinfection immunity protein [Endomicrobiia bacterium]
MEILFLVLAGIIGLWIYFLPTFIAKKDVGLIFFLNLFLGWTFIGWIAVLIMAFTTRNK